MNWIFSYTDTICDKDRISTIYWVQGVSFLKAFCLFCLLRKTFFFWNHLLSNWHKAGIGLYVHYLISSSTQPSDVGIILNLQRRLRPKELSNLPEVTQLIKRGDDWDWSPAWLSSKPFLLNDPAKPLFFLIRRKAPLPLASRPRSAHTGSPAGRKQRDYNNISG